MCIYMLWKKLFEFVSVYKKKTYGYFLVKKSSQSWV